MSDPMSKDDLIEALAEVEHQRWADWQKYLHEKTWTHNCVVGREWHVIDEACWDRWERQIAQSYAELSEREKDSDREQVARYWPLIVEFVAEWLEADAHSEEFGSHLAESWRVEMA